MKRTTQKTEGRPNIDAAMQLIDAEMAKIVATIAAARPVRAAGKPRAPRAAARRRAA